LDARNRPARPLLRHQRPYLRGAPCPAARFACNPLLSGTDGGHDIHLRRLGRRGMHLHGRLENVDDGDVTFTDDLPERLATVAQGFNQRMRKAIDGYIAAAGLDAPDQEPVQKTTGFRQNLPGWIWPMRASLPFVGHRVRVGPVVHGHPRPRRVGLPEARRRHH